MKPKNPNLIREGLDRWTIFLYFLLVLIGLVSLYAVEHRAGDQFVYSLVHLKTHYSRQLLWVGISCLLGLVVLMTDSKFFTATANILYVLGLLLLVVVLFAGRNINGSHSWLVVAGFQFQPAELTKLTTNLALAKYLSGTDLDFTRLRSRLVASALILVPAAIIVFQSETGLALVYLCFFLVLFREGVPAIFLLVGFSLVLLVLSALLVDKHILFGVFTGIALLALYLMRRSLRKKRSRILLVLGIWAFCVGFVLLAVPFVFRHILKPYQVTRIEDMLGKHVSARSSYNVLQSKIAIGSGGLLGRGYMQGTQTRFDFVPEQSTDFIFCTIGEDFGFLGSVLLLGIYLALLLRILLIAERQRSAFTRVYAYGVASILFFHVAINIGMTMGLAPVIGIPLPFISYGGSSMITFTLLLSILIRLDADRQKVLR